MAERGTYERAREAWYGSAPLGIGTVMRGLNIDPLRFAVETAPGSGETAAGISAVEQGNRMARQLRSGDYGGALSSGVGAGTAWLETMPLAGSYMRGSRTLLHGLRDVATPNIDAIRNALTMPSTHTSPEVGVRGAGPFVAAQGTVNTVPAPEVPVAPEDPDQRWSGLAVPPRVTTPPSEWTFDVAPMVRPLTRLGVPEAPNPYQLPRLGMMDGSLAGLL